MIAPTTAEVRIAAEDAMAAVRDLQAALVAADNASEQGHPPTANVMGYSAEVIAEALKLLRDSQALADRLEAEGV